MPSSLVSAVAGLHSAHLAPRPPLCPRSTRPTHAPTRAPAARFRRSSARPGAPPVSSAEPNPRQPSAAAGALSRALDGEEERRGDRVHKVQPRRSTRRSRSRRPSAATVWGHRRCAGVLEEGQRHRTGGGRKVDLNGPVSMALARQRAFREDLG